MAREPWRPSLTFCARLWPRDMIALLPDSPLVDRVVVSPNYGERRGYGRPNCLIFHYTGMPTGEAALKALTDPACEVSSHYLIWEDGSIDQLVAERDRAWHAGRGSWKGESDLNSASIGIEIVNPGHDGGSPSFPDRQIEATIALARDIGARWTIAPERVLAHSDIAPARKRDPGELFPWAMLWRGGVGHWVEPAPLIGSPLFAHEEESSSVRAVQAMLAVYGYGVEITGVYDRQTRQVVAAFQRHFRPERVDGEADASTMATLKALIDGLTPNLT
jgi:N-acetylmuramoyl-L-alanine amidase